MKEFPQEEIEKEVKKINSEYISAMNILGVSAMEYQQKAWSNIVETYYKEVDEDSFNVFLKDRKKEILWECDMVIMQSALNLAAMGYDEGIDALNSLGIKGETLEDLTHNIKAKITSHDLKTTNKKGNVEAPNFFNMLAKVRKHGYTISGDILLEEWVGTLNDLKETNERNNTKE